MIKMNLKNVETKKIETVELTVVRVNRFPVIMCNGERYVCTPNQDRKIRAAFHSAGVDAYWHD